MLGDNEHDRYGDGPIDHPAGRGPSRGALVRDRGPAPAPYPSFEWYGDEGEKGSQVDFQKYLRILQRHWLIIAAALIIAVAGGIAQTMLTTKIYTATATVQIEREAARVSNIESFEPREAGTSDEFFQTQYGLLKSRSLAEATARDSRLEVTRNKTMLRDLGIVSPKGGKPLTTAQIQSALTDFIQRNLSVAPVQRSRLVQISIDSPNPAASAQLANAVAANFIDTTLNRRLDSSSYARKFLQNELAREKAKLEDSERQLAEYARNEQIINLAPAASEGGDGKSDGGSASGNQSLAASSLSAMLAGLNTATAERIKAEQRFRMAQAAAGPTAPEILQNSTIQTLKAARAQLEAEYQEKLGTYTPNFENMRQLRDRISDISRQIDEETRSVQRAIIASVETQYRLAAAQEQQLQAQVNRLQSSVLDLRGRSIKYDILQREVDTSRQLYDGLLQSYKEIGVAGNLGTNNISIIDPAQTPGWPSKPRPVRTLLSAIVLGLAIGVGLAFLLESLDESVRSPEDVEKKLALPLLGTIPKLDKNTTPLIALSDPRSNFSEAYYSVRTALQFSTNEGVPSSLVVTSARPSEGKSTSSTAIAQHFARLGSRVLLIDSDLRNPSLHKVMSAENTHGFSNYLTGGMSLVQLAQETSIPGLSFIPCGPMPPNPAELLGAAKLTAMLNEARAHYDVVLIDAPPVMGLADAPLLASAAAGTILVVEAGGTGRKLAKTAIRRLLVGNAHLLGILLTKFDARKSSYGYGYGYAYDYEYGARPAIKANS